ncbi:hypothetical protein LIT38_20425 [Bacillus sp. CMF12]|uniref:hypothetical protein n=1 Tax=Bacillus sp. CMF12 TaxID=2884834 RepID=UPI00207A088E|nr:hypothetical protein [Bacillus sp. CMF12]USK48878.1 hypothetical protein LIT38_20425 [Bacillus sp. CMF12]
MNWNNEWFVGISVGLISGLILFFIQLFVTSKIGKKEYYKRVTQANNEVLAILKSAISEEEYPSIQIFNGLISSIARKHNVKYSDLNSVPDILEDLIREVFETNFMSIDKKISSSNKLIELKLSYEELYKRTVSEFDLQERSYKQTSTFVASTTTLVTLITTISVMYTFLRTKIGGESLLGNNFDDSLFLMTLISLITVCVVVVILSFIHYTKKSENLKKRMSNYSESEQKYIE